MNAKLRRTTNTPANAKAQLAYAYVRVSTEGQTQAAGAVSDAEQLDEVRAYAAELGITITDEICEVQSASKPGAYTIVGKTVSIEGARAKFIALVGRLLEKDCPVRILIIPTLDRASRNSFDDGLCEQLIYAGVEIHCVRDRLVLNRETWEQYRLSVRVRGVVAAEEAAIRNARVEAGRRGKAKAGHHVCTRAPVGWRQAPVLGSQKKHRPLELDPDTAPLLLKVCKMAAQGHHGSQEVWEYGIKLGVFKNRSHNSLARVLSHPILIGGRRNKEEGDVFEGINPPLLKKENGDADRDMFFKIQNWLKTKKRIPVRRSPEKKAHVWTRMLACSECGARYTSTKRNGGVYWKCPKSGCCSKSVPDKVMHELMELYLDRMSLAPEQAQKFATIVHQVVSERAPDTAVAQLDAEHAKVNKEIARLRARVVEDDLDPETLAAVKDALRAAIERGKQLAHEREALKNQSVSRATDLQSIERLLGECVGMGQRWRGLGDASRRMFLFRLLADDDGLPIVVDAAARELVSVKLRPTWATIARLARGVPAPKSPEQPKRCANPGTGGVPQLSGKRRNPKTPHTCPAAEIWALMRQARDPGLALPAPL